MKAATALRLLVSGLAAQGSRVAATLGFEPESRWDSVLREAARVKSGSSCLDP